jgi:hypothetical protein
LHLLQCVIDAIVNPPIEHADHFPDSLVMHIKALIQLAAQPFDLGMQASDLGAQEVHRSRLFTPLAARFRPHALRRNAVLALRCRASNVPTARS